MTCDISDSNSLEGTLLNRASTEVFKSIQRYTESYQTLKTQTDSTTDAVSQIAIEFGSQLPVDKSTKNEVLKALKDSTNTDIQKLEASLKKMEEFKDGSKSLARIYKSLTGTILGYKGDDCIAIIRNESTAKYADFECNEKEKELSAKLWKSVEDVAT